MTFLRTKTGIYLNLAAVREARIVGDDQVMVQLETGATHQVDRAEWLQSVETGPATALPAAQGTYVLHTMRDRDKLEVLREPIIGWLITGSKDVCLVTAGHVIDWDENFAVLHPDGRVQDFFTYYENYTEWLEDTTFEALESRLPGKRVIH